MMRSYSSLIAFRQMIGRGEYLVLDTETTGLNRAEIVQIAVIDAQDNVLLDTLVRPVNRIPYDATRIHGITDSMVADAPAWGDLTSQVEALLRGRDLVVYNAVFDRRMLHQTAEAARLPPVDWKMISRWWCAMQAFAEAYVAARTAYGGRPRWHKLANAVRHYGIAAVGTHSALGDARLTLALARAMAAEN
jgi:DNA polymerase III subunit epsilon